VEGTSRSRCCSRGQAAIRGEMVLETQPEGTDTNVIHITADLAIPMAELEFQFSRSGGPGGQNVNRRETRVELLFDLGHSPSLGEPQRERLLARLAGQVDRRGFLRIVASAERSQLLNRQLALMRFVELMRRGMYVPRPRRRTRPSRATMQRRLTQKRLHAERKALRNRLPPDDA
jgi:ribosome-associated protein